RPLPFRVDYPAAVPGDVGFDRREGVYPGVGVRYHLVVLWNTSGDHVAVRGGSRIRPAGYRDALPGGGDAWAFGDSDGSHVQHERGGDRPGGRRQTPPRALVHGKPDHPQQGCVTVETSYEGLMDTDAYQDGSWAQFLPTEAQNSYTDKRSDILLNAVSGTANATFNGL